MSRSRPPKCPNGRSCGCCSPSAPIPTSVRRFEAVHKAIVRSIDHRIGVSDLDVDDGSEDWWWSDIFEGYEEAKRIDWYFVPEVEPGTGPWHF